MFRFANPNRENMRPLMNAAAAGRVALTLAGKPLALDFSKKHFDDLRAVMQEDLGPANEGTKTE
jgi:hypothetical protein